MMEYLIRFVNKMVLSIKKSLPIHQNLTCRTQEQNSERDDECNVVGIWCSPVYVGGGELFSP